jgi:hypothetical protein
MERKIHLYQKLKGCFDNFVEFGCEIFSELVRSKISKHIVFLQFGELGLYPCGIGAEVGSVAVPGFKEIIS